MIIATVSTRPMDATALPASGLSTSASARADKATPANPELQHLSQADFELIYQATGQRIDASSEIVPMFAVQLANDRRYGDLPAQGPVPADYLARLISRYDDSPWMVEQAARALSWVEQRGGRSGIDLSA